MAYWKSRGLRGQELEEVINFTNEKYLRNNLALITKVPTPIKPVQIDDSRHITLAYFEKKSTVDYIGVVQGVPVCFDAKECKVDTFPMMNIHKHQFEYMENFEKQGGVAFIIVYYSERNLYYYLRFEKLKEFYLRQEHGRKSFCFDEIEEDYIIENSSEMFVHYLEMVKKDVESRN